MAGILTLWIDGNSISKRKKITLTNIILKYLFLTSSLLSLDKYGNSNNFFVLNASKFEEVVTSTVFDGYIGIQNTNEVDVCCPTYFHFKFQS